MRTQVVRLRHVLGIALALLAAGSAANAQGYSFTVKTTIQSPMMSGVVMLANAVADAQRGRMDIVQALQPGPMSPGDFMLFSKEKTTFVRPASKEYSEVTPFQMANQATAMGGAAVKVSNVKVSGESVGTDTVGGRRTRHVRMTQEYAMGIDMGGMHQDAAIHTVSDFWFADLPVMSNPFSSATLAKPDSAASPLAELFGKTYETMKALDAGFLMKEVITSSTSAMGQSVEVVQTTEISDLKPAALDRSKLAVPAGFTKTEFKPGAR